MGRRGSGVACPFRSNASRNGPFELYLTWRSSAQSQPYSHAAAGHGAGTTKTQDAPL